MKDKRSATPVVQRQLGPPQLNKRRVLVIDDESMIRRGFRLLMDLEPDLCVCGEAGTVNEALLQTEALGPDAAVVDIRLPDGDGLDLVAELRKRYPALKLLVFSMKTARAYATRAFAVGANGYVAKEEGAEQAVEAVRAVLAGQTYLSKRIGLANG